MIYNKKLIFISTIRYKSTLVDLYYVKGKNYKKNFKFGKKGYLQILLHSRSSNRLILITLLRKLQTNLYNKYELIQKLLYRYIDILNERLKQEEVTQNNYENNNFEYQNISVPDFDFKIDDLSSNIETENNLENQTVLSFPMLTDTKETEVENTAFKIPNEVEINERSNLIKMDFKNELHSFESDDVITKSDKTIKSRVITKQVEFPDKIIWNGPPQKLKDLFFELFEEGFVSSFDSEVLSDHFEFTDNVKIENQSKTTISKIEWIGQQTKLVFLVEYLRMRGLITIKNNKNHKMIFDHFCKPDCKDYNTHTLAQSLINISSVFTFKKINKAFTDLKKLIDNHI